MKIQQFYNYEKKNPIKKIIPNLKCFGIDLSTVLVFFNLAPPRIESNKSPLPLLGGGAPFGGPPEGGGGGQEGGDIGGVLARVGVEGGDVEGVFVGGPPEGGGGGLPNGGGGGWKRGDVGGVLAREGVEGGVNGVGWSEGAGRGSEAVEMGELEGAELGRDFEAIEEFMGEVRVLCLFRPFRICFLRATSLSSHSLLRSFLFPDMILLKCRKGK